MATLVNTDTKLVTFETVNVNGIVDASSSVIKPGANPCITAIRNGTSVTKR